MFWFLKEVEKFTDQKKKIDQPCIEPVSRQNKLASGQFSALYACANEATVRELRNYMNNKTSGKYHASVTSSFSKTKVLLFFAWQKIFKRYPWKTEFFCIPYFLKAKHKSTKTITQWCFSCQNKSVCQKLAWSCKK